MKNIFKTIPFIFIALLLSACGAPEINGTSEESIQKSIQVMSENLSPEKKETFQDAVKEFKFFIFMDIRQDNQNKSYAELDKATYAKMNGKTVDDIIEWYDNVNEIIE